MPKQRVDDIQDEVSKQETDSKSKARGAKKPQVPCMDFHNDAHGCPFFESTE